jgi:hypothetical protein
MTIRRAAALLFLLLLFPAVQHATEEHINYINMYVRLDDQNQYGLHKLTKAERGRLNEVFGSITERLNDNLRNSALAYMKEGGWSELEITGTEMRELDPTVGPERLVTAQRSGVTYSLEPLSVSTLMPGQYLARFDSSGCRVINSRGSVVDFRVR